MSTIKSDSIQPTSTSNNLILRTGVGDVERMRISPAGGITFSSAVDMTSTLNVSGAATLNNTLNVGAATQLGTTLLVAGVSTLAGTTASTLDVTGAARFNGGATLTTTSVTGNLSFNSGYGSSAVGYGCRAWAKWNTAGTLYGAISGNVSSITDNGVGYFTVNFITAMPDANYCVTGQCSMDIASCRVFSLRSDTSYMTTSSFRCITNFGGNTDTWGGSEGSIITTAVFR